METFLFIGPGRGLRETAALLASALPMEIRAAGDASYPGDLELVSSTTLWRLYEHTMEGDGGLDYRHYPLVLAGDSEGAAAEGRRLFEFLRASSVPALLVEELERKVAEFRPAANAA